MYINEFNIEVGEHQGQPTYVFEILFKAFMSGKENICPDNSDLGIRLSLAAAVCLSNFYKRREDEVVVEFDSDIDTEVDNDEYGKVKNAGIRYYK